MRSFTQLFQLLLISFGLSYSIACSTLPNLGRGGADDMVTMHLPFEAGYRSMCTQGTGGQWSHNFRSTRYALDFNTPNDRDDIVVAPIGGRAYVHDNPHDGFGRHVNISLGDGTYITLAHLEKIAIGDRAEIGLGQVIGYEGSTGNSTGDHVHLGRSLGLASSPAGQGESISTLSLMHAGPEAGMATIRHVTDFDCGLPNGTHYTSVLPPIRQHPDGTLIKEIGHPDVFLVNDGTLHKFEDEDNFWSHNYDFRNVVITTPDELQCYQRGHDMRDTQIQVAFDGHLWLLLGQAGQGDAMRHLVDDVAWQEILLSWGIFLDQPGSASRNAHLIDQFKDSGFYANFRDGTLLREESRNDVYVVSNGVGQPVLDWEVMRRFGFADREVIFLEDGTLNHLLIAIGNCRTGQFCLDHAFVESCGLENSMIPKLPGRRVSWGIAGAPADNPELDDDLVDSANEDTHTSSNPPCSSIEWYLDQDGDGFGHGNPVIACQAPGQNHVLITGDCNDSRSDIYPGAPEVCNGHDSNCNGLVDGVFTAGDRCPPTDPGQGSDSGTGHESDEVEICWSRQSSNPDRHLNNARDGHLSANGVSGGNVQGSFVHLCLCTSGKPGDIMQGNVQFGSTDHRQTSFGRPRVPPDWDYWWAFTLNNGIAMQVGELFADYNCDNQPSGHPLSVTLVSNGTNGRDGRWTLPPR